MTSYSSAPHKRWIAQDLGRYASICMYNVPLPPGRLFDDDGIGSCAVLQVFYPYVLAYVLVAYVQGSLGSAGLLKGARTWLWTPVSQDAYK